MPCTIDRPLIAETDSGNNITAWCTPGICESRDTGGTWETYYYALDGLGTTRQLLDSLQRTTDEYAMNAWGEEHGHLRPFTDPNKPKNPFRFVGKSGYYSDDETGLDLLGVRYYDPLIGRFITPDPSRDGLNWYAYADNDPVNSVDPTGRMSEFAKKVADVGESIPLFGDWAKSTGHEWGMVDSGHGDATQATIDTYGGVACMAAMVTSTIGIAWEIGAGVAARVGPTFPTWREAEEWLAKRVGGSSQVRMSTSRGVRIVDQLSKKKVAHESKYGFKRLTGALKEQILRDSELKAKGKVKDVVWHFFKSARTGKGGASKELLSLLKKNDIKYKIH